MVVGARTTDMLVIVRMLRFGIVVLPLLAGCGASRALGKGMSAYEAGNYQRTIAFCEDHDPDEYDGKKYVRYTVYCGLAYYHAGDVATAKLLLENGESALDEDGGSLKPSVVNDLYRALRELHGEGGAKASPDPEGDEDAEPLDPPGTDPVPGE